MGYFSFLEPQQEEPKNKVFVPQGWKVRKPGQDFFTNEETWADEGDELRAPDERGVATPEETKPYSQRRGESSSKIIQAAEQIISRYEQLSPGDLKESADFARRKVRANPSDAAKVVEKYYGDVRQRIQNPMSMEAFPDLYDKNFTDLEQNIRSLRTMQRGPQEKALTENLASTDLKKNLSELQNLRGQLDAVTKDIASKNLPEAVSARGEEENQKTLGAMNQKARALTEHIRQLEEMTKQSGQVIQPTAPAPGAAAPGDSGDAAQLSAESGTSVSFASDTPVQDWFRGLGFQENDLVPRLHKALTAVGIPPEQWGDKVDPRSGLMRVLSKMDPSGAFAMKVAEQLATARQEDLTNKETQKDNKSLEMADPNMRRLEQKIESREQRMRQLYASLREAPFMQTWPGIILYVLVGIVTQNPAFAAKLVGGRDDRERQMIGNEIKGLQWEIGHFDKQLLRLHDQESLRKKEAARRLQHQQDDSDQRKWELSKMMIQHNLIIQRNAARGNPDTLALKKMATEFQRQLGLASKFQGTMQNEFADPKDRAEAKRNWEHYMRKAAQLDEDIQKFGGTTGGKEEPEE